MGLNTTYWEHYKETLVKKKLIVNIAEGEAQKHLDLDLLKKTVLMFS